MRRLRIAFVTLVVVIALSAWPQLSTSSEEPQELTALPTATATTTATRASDSLAVSSATPPVAATPTATSTAAATSPAAAGGPVAAGGTSSGGVAVARAGRLSIPRIGVDAAIQTLGLNADGTMPAPSGPVDVAAYTFAARPGEVGNFVVAGHVDFANYGPAVFYRLRELRAGDRFWVSLSDGSQLEYRVSSVAVYDEATAPVQEILGPTPTETATLITCAGTFNRDVHAYDERLVVRADRVI